MIEYVAQKQLQNGDVTYQRGDVIQDFDTWNIHARRACLNLEWVLARDQDALEQKDTKVDSLVDQPKLHSKSEQRRVEANRGKLDCPHCDKTDFKSERALKTHIGMAHKE